MNLEPIVGLLPGDRTHYLKAYGSYSFPFGITTGIVLNAMSGTPTSTEWAMDYQGYMPFGRADQAAPPSCGSPTSTWNTTSSSARTT